MHLNKILCARQYITQLWCSALSLTVKKDQMSLDMFWIYLHASLPFIGKNPWILQWRGFTIHVFCSFYILHKSVVGGI